MNIENIRFKDDDHKHMFEVMWEKCRYKDIYYMVLCYLIAVNCVTVSHYERIIDFRRSQIRPKCLNEPWQTGSSLATTRLAFLLFTGYAGGFSEVRDDKPERYSVDYLFSGYEDEPYFIEAICMRYSIPRLS